MSFKICTIGCGDLATECHGPSYAKYAATHPHTELVACCDIDEAKARGFRERFGFQHHETDLLKMLRTHRPDAVCLIAPVELTCALSCQILEQGYPLLVEKPPGRSRDELSRMIAAAESGKARTQVAFNRRHAPLVARLKQMLAQTFSSPEIQHLSYEFVRVNRFDDDFSTTAIHGIDTVRFLAGSDYCSIHFRYQAAGQPNGALAKIVMDCELKSGATAQLHFCPSAGAVVERASVHVRDHSFFLNIPMWNGFDFPGRLLHLHQAQTKLELSGRDLTPDCASFELGGFYAENAAFFDDIRSGRRPAGDLADARQAVEIMECIRERRSEYVSNDKR